jgi:hypothetical protein
MKKLIFGLTAIAGIAGVAALTYQFAVRPFRSWGTSPEQSARALPGDELLPDASGGETRTITIEAPPASVWPWLVQMGYGRGGWYSFDAMDTGASSNAILPEFQSLAEGDVVPANADTGLIVRRLDPGHALVLYIDSGMTGEQSRQKSPMDMSATWAFVLDELPDNRTQLVERIRFQFGETDKPWLRHTLPMMGFGAFMVLRKQLEGIKQRAEQTQEPVLDPAKAMV